MFVRETTFQTVAPIDNQETGVMLLQLKLLYMFLNEFELKLPNFQMVLRNLYNFF